MGFDCGGMNDMNGLPQDPMILYSVLNTKLRDYYPSLDQLCEDLDVDQEKIKRIMASAGFTYDPDNNQFV